VNITIFRYQHTAMHKTCTVYITC